MARYQRDQLLAIDFLLESVKMITAYITKIMKELFVLKMKFLHDQMERLYNHNLNGFDLTVSQFHVMGYLFQHLDRDIPVKELEHYFSVAQATMAGIVVRLEQKGYVETYTSEEDKRIKIVKLSQKGKKLGIDSMKQIKTIDTKLLKDFSEEEKQQLFSYLDRIYKTAEKEAA